MDAAPILAPRRRRFGRLIPGLALTVAVALLAVLLRRLPGISALSPLMIAVLIGMTIASFQPLSHRFQSGIAFAARKVLRLAIVLLGFQLSIGQILAVGIDGLVIVLCVVTVTFAATIRIGKKLGVDAGLAGLLAAGTSICGASAVAAMSTANKAKEEDVIYAMGAVTVLGTVLMFLMPIGAYALGLDAREFGIWTGAAIHEVAQVSGAAFQFSDSAGEVAIVVKLTRVLMLVPLVVVSGLWLTRRNRAGEAAVAPVLPWFAFGFALAVVLNSLMPMPPDARTSLMTVTTFLMSMSLAALGFQTDIGKLRAKGVRPFALAALATLLIVGLSLGLIAIVRWMV